MELDVYQIYEASFQRDIQPVESTYLEELIREYPYFAFLHYLKAKHKPDDENIFSAAAYSVNRRLLKNYLDGKVVLTDLPTPPSMSEKLTQLPDSNRPIVRHDLFAILSFGDEVHPAIPIRTLFSIAESDVPAFDPFEEMRTKEHNLLETEESIVDDFQPVDNQRNSVAFEQELVSSPNNDTDNLIDSFLADIPVIQRPKPGEQVKETHSVAFASVEEDEDIVSETLAILNWKQNNKPEAIRIYEKLCLLYPEKSAYFEAQISKIKE